ncbi:14557_t:CDS:10 [Entrophospora sp. SA101]|nr:14557_t:CDS:10 [Entrophospora sp. SA101]
MKESDTKTSELEQQLEKEPKNANNDNDNDNGPFDRTKELQKVEQSEEKINKFLQEQLNHASLEASMEARAKSFQNTLAKLQINQNNTISAATLTTDAAIDSQKSILNSEDPILLKKELEKAFEIVRQQELEIKKLKFELEMVQGHINILRHDNQMLRQKTHASAEQEEEFISNKLLKRISNLKKEKGELLLQVEQEEEYLTNTLQKKLNQLQKEKIDMENAFEQEQDNSSISSNSSSTSNTSAITNTIHQLPQSSPLTSSIHKKWISSSPEYNNNTLGLTDVLKLEINSLRSKIADMEKEYISKSSQATRFKNELIELRKKSGLQVDDLLSEETSTIFRPNNNHQKATRRTSSVSISGTSNSSGSNSNNPNTTYNTISVRNRSVSTSDVKTNSASGFLVSPIFISSSSPLASSSKSTPTSPIPSSSTTDKSKN